MKTPSLTITVSQKTLDRIAAEQARETAINKLARRIASRLEQLHVCGKAHDKTGNPVSIAQTVPLKSRKLATPDNAPKSRALPLSPEDREELFLAARAGLIQAKRQAEEKGEQIELRDAWRLAASQARAALYRLTKEPTFASRKRAETAGTKANARFLETCNPEELENPEPLAFDTDHEGNAVAFWKSYRASATALVEFWQAKIAGFHNYNRAMHDFTLQLRTLAKIARDSRDGTFTFPAEKTARNTEYKRLARIAENIQAGRALLNGKRDKVRRALIGAPIAQAQGIRQARELQDIPCNRAEIASRDTLCKAMLSCRLIDNARASRAQLENLVTAFQP